MRDTDRLLLAPALAMLCALDAVSGVAAADTLVAERHVAAVVDRGLSESATLRGLLRTLDATEASRLRVVLRFPPSRLVRAESVLRVARGVEVHTPSGSFLVDAVSGEVDLPPNVSDTGKLALLGHELTHAVVRSGACGTDLDDRSEETLATTVERRVLAELRAAESPGSRRTRAVPLLPSCLGAAASAWPARGEEARVAPGQPDFAIASRPLSVPRTFPPGETGSGRMTVLIVDDDPVAAEALQAAVESRGHACHVASSLEEAQWTLLMGRIDAMTLDLALADGDALAWLEDVAEARPELAARTTVVSGRPLGAAEAARAAACGARVLTSGVGMSALVDAALDGDVRGGLRCDVPGGSGEPGSFLPGWRDSSGLN